MKLQKTIVLLLAGTALTTSPALRSRIAGSLRRQRKSPGCQRQSSPGNHFLVRALSCGITLCVASRLSRDQARRIHTPPSTKRLARFRSDYLIEPP